MMDGWKIQELRAAVLSDLRDFIPKNYYINVRTDDDISRKDITLSNQLKLAHYTEPKFTPRQLAAIWMLEKIGYYCHPYTSLDPAADAAEGITPESIKEMSLEHLHDALMRYASHLGADEAKALMPAGAPDTTKKEERISVIKQQDNAILNWLKSNKYDSLKLPAGEQGKSGIRKICGDALRVSCKELFQSKKVFETAWDRLRAEGETKVAS